MLSRMCLILVAFTWLLAVSGYAQPLTWYVQGTFNDGGTFNGSFNYDADANAYSDANITTTAGTVLAGAHYTVAAPSGFLLTSTAADQTGLLAIGIGVIASGFGGTSIAEANEGVCINAACSVVQVERFTANFGTAASSETLGQYFFFHG